MTRVATRHRRLDAPADDVPPRPRADHERGVSGLLAFHVLAVATVRVLALLVLVASACGPVLAHGVKAGDLTIDHPYATPSRPGLTTGAVYFRAIHNNGTEPDRLLSARTPAAAKVELHRMELEGDVMRMRAVPAVELPAKTEVRLRHGGASGYHLMLQGLTAPLKDGDRFPVTLTFERAGSHEVRVWVQTPRGAAGDAAHAH